MVSVRTRTCTHARARTRTHEHTESRASRINAEHILLNAARAPRPRSLQASHPTEQTIAWSGSKRACHGRHAGEGRSAMRAARPSLRRRRRLINRWETLHAKCPPHGRPAGAWRARGGDIFLSLSPSVSIPPPPLPLLSLSHSLPLSLFLTFPFSLILSRPLSLSPPLPPLSLPFYVSLLPLSPFLPSPISLIYLPFSSPFPPFLPFSRPPSSLSSGRGVGGALLLSAFGGRAAAPSIPLSRTLAGAAAVR